MKQVHKIKQQPYFLAKKKPFAFTSSVPPRSLTCTSSGSDPVCNSFHTDVQSASHPWQQTGNLKSEEEGEGVKHKRKCPLRFTRTLHTKKKSHICIETMDAGTVHGAESTSVANEHLLQSGKPIALHGYAHGAHGLQAAR